MKALLSQCMKYMPAACMKSLTLTHEGWEFGFAKFQFITPQALSWETAGVAIVSTCFLLALAGGMWFNLIRNVPQWRNGRRRRLKISRWMTSYGFESRLW